MVLSVMLYLCNSCVDLPIYMFIVSFCDVVYYVLYGMSC